jgi:hypothetical protein
MNRAALEHILRAAAAVANERDIVVIGSQAVLGQFPDAPEALPVSPDYMELLQARLLRVEVASRNEGPQ